MKKTLLLFTFFLSLHVYSQLERTRFDVSNANNQGQFVVVSTGDIIGFLKPTIWEMEMATIRFTGFAGTGTRLTTFASDGAFGSMPTTTFALSANTYTITECNNNFKPFAYVPMWSEITGTPTTLGGYGITDAYPLSGNPSGFLTSFSETDPTVPSYSKSLTAFSVIQADTDLLYRPISYVPTFADVTSKPTTLSGYGIADAYPLSGNPSSFLTVESDPNVPSYSKTLSEFSVIKSSTDPLYKDISYTPSNAEVIAALGGTPLFVEVDGSVTNEIELPSQSGNSGKVLTTNGSAPSWTALKRQETFTVNTNASGIATISYSAYAAVPNIQFTLGVGTGNKETIVPQTATTTGATFLVQLRTDVLGLIPSYSNVVGREVNVLVTEK